MTKGAATSTSRKKAGSKSGSKGGAKPASDVQGMAQNVIQFLEERGKNLDKATIAKYVAVAVLVIYGIRKSNLLGSLTLSLITGIVTKFIADRYEGEIGELIPSAAATKE